MLVALPETLLPAKRRSLAEFYGAISSLNPLSFLQVYRGRNTALKQLMLVNTLQCCAEGRCTSECAPARAAAAAAGACCSCWCSFS